MGAKHALKFVACVVLCTPALFAGGKGALLQKTHIPAPCAELATAVVQNAPDDLHQRFVETLRRIGVDEENIARINSAPQRTEDSWSSELKDFVDENKIPYERVDEVYWTLETRMNAMPGAFSPDVVSRLTKVVLEKMLSLSDEEEHARPNLVYDRFENTDRDAKRSRSRGYGTDGDFEQAMINLQKIHGRIPSPDELTLRELEMITAFIDHRGAVPNRSDTKSIAERNGFNSADLEKWRSPRDALRKKIFFDEAGSPKDIWKSDEGLFALAEAHFGGVPHYAITWLNKNRISTKLMKWNVYPFPLTVQTIREIRQVVANSPEKFIETYRKPEGAIKLANEFGLPTKNTKGLLAILRPTIAAALTPEQVQHLNWFKKFRRADRPLTVKKISRVHPQQAQKLAREEAFFDSSGKPHSHWVGEEGLFAFAERYFEGNPFYAWKWAWKQKIKGLAWPSYRRWLTVPTIRALRERVKNSPAAFVSEYKTLEGAQRLARELGAPASEMAKAHSRILTLVKQHLSPEEIKSLEWDHRKNRKSRKDGAS